MIELSQVPMLLAALLFNIFGYATGVALLSYFGGWAIEKLVVRIENK